METLQPDAQTVTRGEIEPVPRHKVICVMGPSGIGKDTALDNVCATHPNLIKVSPGALFREILQDDNKCRGLEPSLGANGADIIERAKAAVLEGLGISPTEFVTAVLSGKIMGAAKEQTLVFTGWPRKAEELESMINYLDQTGQKNAIDFHYVYLAPNGDPQAWKNEMEQRYSARGEAEQRKDDLNPEIVKIREAMWRDNIVLLLKAIRHSGGRTQYINVVVPGQDGNASQTDMSSRLEEAITKITSP